jgi:hypothetical protein
VGWDLATWDWDRARQKNPGILDLFLRGICEKQGGVVLMHDIQPHTGQNLDEWIEGMKCLGHRHVPLEQFLKQETQSDCCSSVLPTDTAPKLHRDVEEVIREVRQ